MQLNKQLETKQLHINNTGFNITASNVIIYVLMYPSPFKYFDQFKNNLCIYLFDN